jgi:hypothetical protein
MSYAIHSYNRTDGRNNSIAAVRQRVQNKPLQPMSREKENGKRRKVKAVVKMQPRA